VREQAASYNICTIVSKKDAQIFVGSDRSFTYDYVFDRDSSQVDVYDSCIKELVSGVFNGLNATILAYGQVI
jgi:kinesin family protein 4/21/27